MSIATRRIPWWIQLIIAAAMSMLFMLAAVTSSFAQVVVGANTPVTATASSPTIAGGEAVSQAQFDDPNTKTGATVGVFVKFKSQTGSEAMAFCTGWRPELKGGTMANGIFTDRHCYIDPYGGTPAVSAAAAQEVWTYVSTCVVSNEIDIKDSDGSDPAHCKTATDVDFAPNGVDLAYVYMNAADLVTPTALRVCQVYPEIGRKVQIQGWGNGWVLPQANLRWISIDSGHQEVIPSNQCEHSSNPRLIGEEICTKDTIGNWQTRTGDSGAPMVVNLGGNLCAAGWYISGHAEPYSWAGSFTQHTTWLVELGIIDAPVYTSHIYLPLTQTANTSSTK